LRELLAQWKAAWRELDWEQLDGTQRDKLKSVTQWPLIHASDAGTYSEIGRDFVWLKMEIPDIEGVRLALLDPESRLRRKDEGEPGLDYPMVLRIAIEGTDFFEDLGSPQLLNA
jgi:hypothetical protein